VRTLVTGATGFLGSHVVDRLVEEGRRVRAHVLEPDRAPGLEARGIEVRVGDLLQEEDLAPLVEGVDVVIHCAGVAAQRAPRENIWRVNVEGTKRLLAACSRAALPRFVYISSVAVYGHAPPPVAEDAPKNPVNVYGESKVAAEDALWRCHSEHGLPAVALRPCLVYGERDRRLPQFLSRMSRLPLLPLPRGGNRIVALVHVEDVVSAIVAASTAAQAPGRAYNVTDGAPHTYRDVIDHLKELTGRSPRIVPVPAPLFSASLKLLLRLSRREGRAASVDLSKSIRIFEQDSLYSLDAARRDLGFTPRVGLHEGLERTLAWSASDESRLPPLSTGTAPQRGSG